MNEAQLKSLLRLYSIPGIGSTRMRNLINAFGSAENVLNAPLRSLLRIPGIEKTTAQNIKAGISETFLEYQYKFFNAKNIATIPFWSTRYPEELKKIFDPPSVLFVQGNAKINTTQAIAVVGTREPTMYGISVTESITRDLVQRGFTIISGMARGIDTIAHQTALTNGGKTIAVLGSGLDMIYPPENLKLANHIIATGSLISEYPLGTKPDPGNFPRRNRIVSGLSLGVIVTEAGLKSGAIITAYEALEQNREVFAIPGPINAKNSQGTNHLIKEGAKLVQSVDDILQELESKIRIETVHLRNLPKLNAKENEIFSLLEQHPMHIDQLARHSGRPTNEVLSVLLTLELMGLIRQLSGKMFVRI